MAAALAVSIVCASAAEAGRAAVRRHTEIPAQELGPALQTLAKQHEFQLIYLSDEINERYTAGALGELASQEALRRLLEGTGLTFRYLDDKTVMILPTPGTSLLALPEPTVEAYPRNSMSRSTGRNNTSASATRPARSASDIEEVIVPGIRGSLRRSVEIEHSASLIVDAIAVEDLGASLGKNAAELLSRVSGINVDRRFGQGEHIGIRGTGPALNRTLLNGQTIASADWFIFDFPGRIDSSGRTFNYTLLTPEMFSSIEIFKSPQARMDEGSIGGTVILHTRRPLDLPADTVRLSLDYAYNDRATEGAPNYSGLYSWRNDSGTLGMLLTALHSEEQLSRHGIGTFSYLRAIDAGLDPALVGNDPSVVFPDRISSELFEQERQRTSATLGLQLSASDTFELNFTGLYVDADYDNYNQIRSAFLIEDLTDATVGNLTDATVRDAVVTSADIASTLTILDAISRRSNVETYAVDLRADWNGEQWSASTTVGATDADGGTQQEYFLSWGGFGGFSYDLGKERASVSFDDDPTDPASLPLLGFGQFLQQPAHDKEQYLQADFAREVGWGPIKQWRAGVKYREHETSQEARLAVIAADALAGQSLSGFVGGATPGNLLRGIDAGGGLRNWLVVDRGALERFVSSASLIHWLFGEPVSSPPAFPTAIFNVQEDVLSAYTQLDLDGAGFRGNIGLRHVQTDQTSSGSSVQGANGNFVPNSISKDYDDFLPSLNLAFDISDGVVLRISASQTMARASFLDLSSFLELDTVNEGSKVGSGGNPELDPYRSSNFDLSGEWYLEQDGLFALTFFYKDIRSFIVRRSAAEQHFNVLTGEVEAYRVSRPRNVAGGKIRGSELTYQNILWGSFGLQANYTYADGGTDSGLQIPFSSKHTVNVTPYFDNGQINARISYGWRSKYFRQFGRNGTAVTTAEYAQLDAAFGIKLTDNIELTAQVLNLLDETHYEYAGRENRPLGCYKNGRRYFVGVRFAL